MADRKCPQCAFTLDPFDVACPRCPRLSEVERWQFLTIDWLCQRAPVGIHAARQALERSAWDPNTALAALVGKPQAAPSVRPAVTTQAPGPASAVGPPARRRSVQIACRNNPLEVLRSKSTHETLAYIDCAEFNVMVDVRQGRGQATKRCPHCGTDITVHVEDQSAAAGTRGWGTWKKLAAGAAASASDGRRYVVEADLITCEPDDMHRIVDAGL